MKQSRSVFGHSGDLRQYGELSHPHLVLYLPLRNSKVKAGTVAGTLRPPRLAGIYQGGISRFEPGGNVILAVTPHALKLRNDDACSVFSAGTGHGKLGKGYWAGRKACEFEAGQGAALNRAVEEICLGKLKPRVPANLLRGPAPRGQPIRGGYQVS